jgi:hypothetical protein
MQLSTANRTEGPREPAAVRGDAWAIHCSWLSNFRTPTLKNHQAGMPPNGPTSVNIIILLKIDMFYDKACHRLYSYIKTLFLIELGFRCMSKVK